jgi:hypothetical protein
MGDFHIGLPCGGTFEHDNELAIDENLLEDFQFSMAGETCGASDRIDVEGPCKVGEAIQKRTAREQYLKGFRNQPPDPE